MKRIHATADGICFVYKIVCKTNGKTYFGLTKNVEQRWTAHKKTSGYSDTRKRGVVHNAMRKYGVDAFEITVVYEAVNLREAIAVERGLIAEYGTMNKTIGYNCSAGGDTYPGISPSKEARASLSARNLGRPVEQCYRARRIEKNGGHWHSPSTIEKIKQKKHGCKLPASYLIDRRARNGGKWHPPTQPEKLRALWATKEFRDKQSAAVRQRQIRKADVNLYGPSTAGVRAMLRKLQPDYFPREVANV